MPEVKNLAKIICDPYIFFQIFPSNRCRDIRVFVNEALFGPMPRHLGLTQAHEAQCVVSALPNAFALRIANFVKSVPKLFLHKA